MTLSTPPPHVLIIGGGLAGTAVALRLLKDADRPLRLTIVESRAEVGPGLAYSTTHPEHLVNGLAKLFSAYDDDPDHLVRWLEGVARAGRWQPPAGVAIADSLPPRQLYGDYLRAALAEALARTRERIAVAFTHRRARAIDVERRTASEGPGFRVTLDDGGHEAVDQLVLATGVFTRPLARQGIDIHPAVLASPRYLRDIWSTDAWRDLAGEQNIVYLGGGLSALDALIMAEKAGFRGEHTVLTRRGLPVHAREDAAPWPDFLRYDPSRPVLREVLAQIRRQRHELRRRGESWQRLVPAIRPHVPALWAGASARDRRRFLGRLRSYWEAALHRSAAPPLRWQASVAIEGRFAQRAGRVVAVTPGRDGRLLVNWLLRGVNGEAGKLQTLVADRVVNCLGFEFDWQRIEDPLVRQLVARGLVRPDPLGFGIGATRAGHEVLDAAGRPQPGLYVVGHALRGLIWESNAISEHVPQAGTVGRAIVGRLAAASAATALAARLLADGAARCAVSVDGR